MKFNLGCGWRNFGKDWIHVDGGDYDHLDDNDIYYNYDDLKNIEFLAEIINQISLF